MTFVCYLCMVMPRDCVYNVWRKEHILFKQKRDLTVPDSNTYIISNIFSVFICPLSMPPKHLIELTTGNCS